MAPHERCPTCGAKDDSLIPVWEEVDDFEAGDQPDWVGCTACHTMHPTEEVA